MVLGIFKIAFRLRGWHVFMWQPQEILNIFSTLTLKQIFCKTQNFFKKLEYRFLDENTKIENATFSCKTALSGANVQTSTLGSTKWVYHKDRSFFFNWRGKDIKFCMLFDCVLFLHSILRIFKYSLIS